jgi:hypothetical protein
MCLFETNTKSGTKVLPRFSEYFQYRMTLRKSIID